MKNNNIHKIYINGIKASKKDLARLIENLNNGSVQVTITRTAKGNLSIKTND